MEVLNCVTDNNPNSNTSDIIEGIYPMSYFNNILCLYEKLGGDK